MTKTRIGALVAAGVAVVGAVAAGVRTLLRRRRPWYRRIEEVVPRDVHRPRMEDLRRLARR